MESVEERKHREPDRLPGVRELLSRSPIVTGNPFDSQITQAPRTFAELFMGNPSNTDTFPKPRTPAPPYNSKRPMLAQDRKEQTTSETIQPLRSSIPPLTVSSTNGSSLSSSHHSYTPTPPQPAPIQLSPLYTLPPRPEQISQPLYWEPPETQASKSPPINRPVSHTTSGDLASPPAASNQKFVVGVRELPGQGEQYVFSDNTTLPTTIGNEQVNPNWGITKAGKPRKRLAQACTECREKKVKCEPGEVEGSKCSHCSRLNRECRRPNEGRFSPERDAKANGFKTAERVPAKPENILPANPKRTITPPERTYYQRPAAPAPPYVPESIDHRRPLSVDTRPPSSTKDVSEGSISTFTSRPASERREAPIPGALGTVESHKFSWNVDPYYIDPATTMHFLRLFFANRATRAYTIVPTEHFLKWVETSKNKSPDDRMVIYALGALGSIFTDTERLRVVGEKFGRIAEKAEQSRADTFTLQLAQTRAHIALYFFGKGRFETAFNHTQTARRAVQMLGYYQERNVCKLPENPADYDYGLNAVQLKEARRRVFWIIYLLDRYNGFTFGCMGSIHDIQVYVRLPMNEEKFVEGVDVDTPSFNGSCVREPFTGEPSGMALLVGIITIYGLVTAHAYRAQNRSKVVYGEFYHSYCFQVQQKLDDWDAILPEKMRYSPENTTRSIREGYFGTYFVLHSVYCVIAMKMGRLGRYELLEDDIIRRNLCRSMYFARRYLKIVNELSGCIHGRYSRDAEIEYAFAQPFPGFVMTAACDIVTSGGSSTMLKSLGNRELENAKNVLTQIGRYWKASDLQRESVEGRQRELSARAMSNNGSESIRMTSVSPMDKSHLPDDHDMLYNCNDEIFFGAIADVDNGSDGRIAAPDPESPLCVSRRQSRESSVDSQRKPIMPMGDEIDMIDG